MESLYMGCVSSSRRHFPEGRIDKSALKSAVLEARQEVAGISRSYRRYGWQEAVGSSGTARSIEGILAANGYVATGISREALGRLRELLLKAGRADPDRIGGLKPARAAVLPGGFAVLYAVFEELGIDQMTVSEAALRHGVLYDLLGRVQHHDMREATVVQFMRRYQVDAAQAARVRDLALRIHDQLANAGRGADNPDRMLLDWAARLAEVGLSIAHAQYHKHSAYVLSNADMPGFSRAEQQRLARVVLAHRGKLDKLRDDGMEDADWTLVFALRLASTLLRRRTRVRLPAFKATAGDARFSLELPRAWLARNALTAAALESETRQWDTVGRHFSVRRMS
jgi:exopolyphosphatase/guanosine-5'-triphosphate,3'-diphosphate pyrophosphatase